MPATPVTWLSDFIANELPSGAPVDPVITQLSNGNVLISWTNQTAGVAGASPGYDVIGRIFNPLGQPVTGEFQLNTFGTSDNEEDPEIAAIPGGGFVVVYEDNGTDNNILFEVYDNAGANQRFGYIFNDVAGGAVPNDPAIAVASATSALAAYTVNNADGSESVFIATLNPTTGAVGAPVSIFTGAASLGDDIGGMALTRLSTNNFAVAYSNRNPVNDTIDLLIRDGAG
ncbi:MAG: hypothetical protein ACRCYS_01260, partial [Beijerinckiaceae bacterium]